MGTEKYGFFFFLLSKILSVKCLENNPTESLPYGQNVGAPNYWTGQPDQSVPQGMTNYYNTINPNLPHNAYLNNNNNQQYNNYHQQSSVPQHFISPQQFNPPQQYNSLQQLKPLQQENLPQQLNPPQQFNSPQQLKPPQQLNPSLQFGQNQLQPMPQPVNHHKTNVNTFQPPLNINQKNQNQQSQIPLSNNLHSPPQSSGQGVSHTLGTIGPSLKEHQKQLPTSLDQKITQGLPNFGQVINNAKNQANIPPSPPPIPPISNLSQLPPIPPQLPQNPPQLSTNPLVKGTSTPNGNNMKIKEEEELPDFGQIMNNPNNPENLLPSPPPIPPIPNISQLPQIPPQLPQIPPQFSSNPLVKGTSTPNGNNMKIKEEEELSDFGQIMNNPNNPENLLPSPIPPILNQSQLPQIPPKLPQIPPQFSSNPLVKGTSTSNGNNMKIKEEEELPDFVPAMNNHNNQENLPPSPPPIYPIPNQSQLPQTPPQLSTNPLVKGTSTPNGNNMKIKEEEELPDFVPAMNNHNNQENLPPSPPPIYPIPNQSQLPQTPPQLSTNPLIKGTSTPNGNNMKIKEEEELPNFVQAMNNPENVPPSPPPIPAIPNLSQLPQITPQLSSNPLVKGTSTPNYGNNMKIKEEEELPDFFPAINKPNNPGNLLPSPPPIPPIPNQSQLPQVPPKLPQITPQLSSNPLVKGTSTPNYGNNMKIKEEEELPDFFPAINKPNNPGNLLPSPPPIPPIPNQSQLPQVPPKLPQIPPQFSSNPLIKGTSTPNYGNNMKIKEEEELPDFVPAINKPNNPGNLLPSSPPIPPIPNQSQLPQVPPKLPQIPPQFSSNPLGKGTTTPIGNNIKIKEEEELPDFVPAMNNPNNLGNEDILIDNSQSDIQKFLNSENNDKLNPLNNMFKNQDDSQFVSNDAPSQLPMNVQVENVIINPQPDDITNGSSLNDNTENLQNALNNNLVPSYFEDTEFNEESKLEKAIFGSLPLLENANKENNKLNSLENLTFDEPPAEWESLSKYDKSYIVDKENSKYSKENNAKLTVFANPNDIHILQQSPKQSSTNVNSYPNNNILLNTPSKDMPLWYIPSFPNSVDYVQPFNSNAYKEPPSSLLSVNQNPVVYNQIPMNLANSNYYNQQVDSTSIDQNQMTSKIQSPNLLPDTNQPSSVDNSGSIYKKVDLKNPPPNIYSSWCLPKKDYTKNVRPNQNDRNTNYDGNSRTSIFGTPLSSYQNSIQGILNSPSNDMFVQNMISVISNSVQAPLDGTKAIFDITRVNFPRSPVSHVIRLTHAIVRSVMLNLRQTLNTVMNTLYGRRAKRDLNPFDVLYNLPGALVNKYSDQSTALQKTKNANLPYYNQPTTAALFTGQQPTVDYSVSQPATENMLGQQQMYYGSRTDRNYYGSQYDNIGIVSQSANTQNYVLNSLADAITSAVRSNVPDPYSIDSPEVKEYIQQVIVTIEIVFKNQIDNILRGQSPTLNMY
ncbi:transcription factor mef2A-like isoform X2 [Rhopalosiphum padi]|uniref:transcription factor mef2A-like isoform X2 n=1 Tax=Rhopalosiphum padi TaxID=40932 RepID=UPI00298E24AF|nr:transcription factor mef2A-like isoform X2 [Rhopalosiphum padi]